MNTFRCATENSIRSIVLPSIATGHKGFPLEKAAFIGMKALFDFMDDHLGEIDNVYFIFKHEQTLDVYKSIWQKLQCTR